MARNKEDKIPLVKPEGIDTPEPRETPVPQETNDTPEPRETPVPQETNDTPEPRETDILTHDDLKKQEKKEIKKKVEEKKEVKINVKFECPYAPMGESQTVLTINIGKEKKPVPIKLFNKIFTMPDDIDKTKKVLLRQLLIDNGFKDITEIHAGVTYDKEKKQYTYAAVHPEHTSQNPITGNISLAMYNEKDQPIYDEKTKQQKRVEIAIVNGLVKTDDPGIYQALLKAGFRSGYVREV